MRRWPWLKILWYLLLIIMAIRASTKEENIKKVKASH